MQTVQDAIFAGKTDAVISCSRCHQTYVRKLADLPGLLGDELIGDLHRRLVCSVCGFRPSVLDVQVREPTPLPRGAYPDWNAETKKAGAIPKDDAGQG